MQHKKCPSFGSFNIVFGESPNCKPVHPMEVGGSDEPDSIPESLDDAACDVEGEGDIAPSPRKVPAPKHCVVTPKATIASALATAAIATGGNPPATFHLAPSKKDKKMDLAEAYLRAQQSRIESAAASTQSKNRCDMIVAFVAQGKTSAEISVFLTLAGLG
jgi:hypothetical protein